MSKTNNTLKKVFYKDCDDFIHPTDLKVLEPQIDDLITAAREDERERILKTVNDALRAQL